MLAFSVLVMLCFSGCGKAEPKITVVARTPSPDENPENMMLEGGWYGYWSISDATRDWKSVAGKQTESQQAEQRQKLTTL